METCGRFGTLFSEHVAQIHNIYNEWDSAVKNELSHTNAKTQALSKTLKQQGRGLAADTRFATDQLTF